MLASDGEANGVLTRVYQSVPAENLLTTIAIDPDDIPKLEGTPLPEIVKKPPFITPIVEDLLPNHTGHDGGLNDIKIWNHTGGEQIVVKDWRDYILTADNVNGQKTKIPKPGVSGKEGAKGVPSWAKGNRPLVGEDGKKFAERLLDEKYGKGNYEKGPKTQFNQIQKWGDRSFIDPK